MEDGRPSQLSRPRRCSLQRRLYIAVAVMRYATIHNEIQSLDLTRHSQACYHYNNVICTVTLRKSRLFVSSYNHLIIVTDISF